MTFEIAKNGIPKCEIVIGKNSELPERFAALELQKYLERITGGQFSVRGAREKRKSTSNRKLPSIVIGSTSDSRSRKRNEDDSFSITKVREGLVISGNSPRATLFGVYWLIQKLGVSFLVPEFDYYQCLGGAEFVTVNRNLKVPETCFGTHTPAFAWRPKDIGEGASHTKSNILQLIDWIAKMSHNILRCPAQGQGSHSNPHRTSWDKWRDLVTPELRKRGILIQVGQHGYQNYLPSDEYFQDHPEWFGKLNGKRVPMSGSVFCTSNSSALQEFTKNVIGYIKARPEIDIFDLWPPDSVPWCDCSNCVALGSESERHAIVVEAIRSALKKEKLRVKLGILAYVHCTEFPERTPISPEVRLDFCPIYRDYKFELNDVVSDINRAEYWDKLLRWRDGWTGEIVIYEYYMKYRFRSFPIVMPRLIAEEHSTYEKLGIRGLSN
ncbi:MAG TPA: DUF4838 domain-containing protein, partial [Nitrososphaerales archaeon]|nr:DUF4838 domain-containing protein [Nitrososphaerales archaeon]